MDIRLVKFLFIAIAIFLLSACQTTQEVRPVLQDSSCAPPCWYQIIPGISTIEDVKLALGSISIVDPKTIQWNNQLSQLTPRVTANFKDDPKAIVYIYFFEGKVAFIEFLGSNGYTFGEAAELLGEPEFIAAIRSSGAMQEWPFPFRSDSSLVRVRAILPDKGIAYGYDISIPEQNFQSKITPNMELSHLYFFYPAHFDLIADRNFSLTDDLNAQEIKDAMTPWNGYKETGTDYPYAQHR
jgi:hypothetical protein